MTFAAPYALAVAIDRNPSRPRAAGRLMSLSPQFLDELRARTTLSGLIGKSVRITRAGREWKACCPFHDEKTPSFTINDDKGFYHWPGRRDAGHHPARATRDR